MTGWVLIATLLQPQAFDLSHKAWAPLPVSVEFKAETEEVRLRLPKGLAGRDLTARLDFKALPHYGEWLAQRQAQGGPTWTALKAVLDEIGDGPAVALTHGDLPAKGPGKVLVGLRRGSKFELYATVPGAFEPCGSALCFEPGEPLFASRSTALAWDLLKPLALKQAKNAARH